MEKHVITGKVGLCPACHHTFPVDRLSLVLPANTPYPLFSVFSLPLELSRLFILCVQHPEPVQADVCPLLALWDGEEEGGG